MNRREFTKTLLSAVASHALLGSVMATQGLHHSVRPVARHWALRLEEYCQDLRRAAITPAEWQTQLAELYQQIELSDLLRFIDFDRLQTAMELPDLGVTTHGVRFPQLEGLPERTAFVKKVFGMQKDRAIIPHGHSNMASSHLILQGELHLRQYEKSGQDEAHLYLLPSVDQRVRPGDASSISDEQTNVHWFVAETPAAYTFDVIMLDLGGQPYGIHNVDMDAGVPQGDGSLRVPVLDVETALKKYGKHHH